MTQLRQIGLITMNRLKNFGSSLQTVALYTVINRLGYSVALIDYQYPGKYHAGMSRTQVFEKKSFFYGFVNFLRAVKHFFDGTSLQIFIQSRRYASFGKRNCPCRTKLYTKESIHKEPPFFSTYMTGSDQTWNPRYLYNDYTFLLDFASDEAKKIAYAASFGKSEIAPQFRTDYSRLLKRFTYATVREKSGEDLFYRLTEGNASFVLDPTFLLNRDQWTEIASQSRVKLPRHYILCYFMFYSFDPYPLAGNAIDFVKKHFGDIPVISLNWIGPWSGKHSWYHSAGPAEFLKLFLHADFVLTSSFHGTAFSINFGKDFISILNPRQSSDDRVYNILHECHMDRHGIRDEKELSDYKFGQQDDSSQLNRLREKSFDHLTTMLQLSVK